MSNISTEDKIDYIYKHIRNERRMMWGRVVFKIIIYGGIFLYIAYFYMYGFDKIKKSIIESLKPSINTENVVGDLKKNGSNALLKAKSIIKSTLQKAENKQDAIIDENLNY